jgi:hypothetical protein
LSFVGSLLSAARHRCKTGHHSKHKALDNSPAGELNYSPYGELIFSSQQMSNRPIAKFFVTAFTTLVGAASLSACAPLAKGVSGYDHFLSQAAATVRTGPQSAAAAAKCFETNGNFLPLSEFSRDSADGSFTYSLRVAGVWYEQVLITPEANGSRAEMRLSPGLNAKWKSDFELDRAGVAVRCLQVDVAG